ncbi:N-acetylgalactosamine-N, N'-diacetylbacillosaminyl-diphospho-undecaprenol 4-alpha-N-acetylgalactosaminyltransferase [Candidatus Magnetomoraceae bacterium gMMP-15]
MTTILINSLAPGGAQKVITILLERFKGDIELICLEKESAYTLSEDIRVKYLSNLYGNESGIKKFLYLPILAWRLKKYIKKQNIKIVQSHLYRANYVNIIARILGAKHKVQIVNAGTISLYYKEGLTGKVNLFLIKHLYEKADLIILKSKGMLEDMLRLFKFKNQSVVINNPYDIQAIHKKSIEKIEDNELQLCSDKNYIISIGRLVSLKNNNILLKAFNKVNEIKDNLELILIGDGPERKILENLANKLQLNDKVHFLGHLQNPFKYLSRSNLFILPSSSEGFPNVLVEAMICKVPVISTDCKSGPREILAPGTNYKKQLKKGIEFTDYGILVPVGNPDILAEAMITMLTNEKLSIKYIQKAYERAKDFSVEKNISKFEEVFYEADSGS